MGEVKVGSVSDLGWNVEKDNVSNSDCEVDLQLKTVSVPWIEPELKVDTGSDPGIELELKLDTGSDPRTELEVWFEQEPGREEEDNLSWGWVMEKESPRVFASAWLDLDNILDYTKETKIIQ